MKKLLLLASFLFPFLLLAQEGAYLGVYELHMSDEKAEQLGFETADGYYIARTIPNTPAAEAGFQSFDYIYAINGEELLSPRDLGDVLDDILPGTSTTFSFIRDGQKESLTVALAERGYRKIPRRRAKDDPFLGVSQNHDKLPRNINGVIVSVSDCSSAEEMGLQDGDIISKIDDRLVLDWNDLHYAIDNRAVGDPIKVNFYRDKQNYEVTQNIKSLAATQDCLTPNEMTKLLVNKAVIVDTTIAAVEMMNVSQAEVEAMKEEKGIDMPIVNNLSITALQLFPNPTSGIFELRFDLPEEGETLVRLFDSSAKLVYQNQLGRFSGNFREQIDISNRVRGTYFLEIRQDELSISKKLILQ
ncbi:MAG: PDZ domain-containing protein [Bacteroidota bacterium]